MGRFVYVLYFRINIYIIGSLSFFDKSYMKCPFILTFSLISTTTLFEELMVCLLVMRYLRI